jgi:hypothetical protein
MVSTMVSFPCDTAQYNTIQRNTTQHNNMNLLPKELVDHIYEYDQTYRIFHKPDFKAEVENGYLRLPSVQEKVKERIHEEFRYMENNRDTWGNDDVFLQNGLWMYNENCHYEWQDHDEVFKLHFKIGSGNIYFKLIGTKNRWQKYDPDEEHDGYLRRGENGNLEFVLWGFWFW